VKENRNERTAKEKNIRNRETKSIRKIGNRKSEKFWIISGVRQGLTLFNIYGPGDEKRTDWRYSGKRKDMINIIC